MTNNLRLLYAVLRSSADGLSEASAWAPASTAAAVVVVVGGTAGVLVQVADTAVVGCGLWGWVGGNFYRLQALCSPLASGLPVPRASLAGALK